MLLNCTVLAQRAVLSRRVGHLREMGSTVVALALGARSAAVAHVGDSRLYRLRDGRLEALTRDHSVLEEMREAGVETPARGESPYGHLITRALGTRNAEPTVRRLEVRAGMCTCCARTGCTSRSGRSGWLHGWDRAVQRSVAERLVEDAFAAGGRDNITAIVVGVAE